MAKCSVLCIFSYVVILTLCGYFIFGLVTADCGLECKDTKSWGEWLTNNVRGWKIPNFSITTDSGVDSELLIKFMLFNKDNIHANPEKFQLSDMGNMYKQFDARKPTKILVHGWMGSVESKFSTAMVRAYLPAFDYNVILVDWADRARKFYPASRQAVPLIGKLLADFIDLLCKTYNIKPESLHLVGHSLGAHVSGVTGRFIKTGKIGRISGLDPAYPLFAEDHHDRLTIESAIFIDVIHTCGKYLGWFGQVGHADFYPNKGVAVQPGCGVDVLGKCSHRRAWVYFSESVIRPNLFMAVPCDSWASYEKGKCKGKGVSMGEYLPTDTRGIFYLKTNKEEPYGRGTQDL
uniref:Venom lipase 1 n=1 Tax=Platymeris rhadamanthus TaxID=1134088 RepID=A0A6B9L573_PLARH|nr:venom lipase 1 [Platymeris rhadamanthus]